MRKNGHQRSRQRLRLFAWAWILGFSVLATRLVQLSVVAQSKYRKRALLQHKREVRQAPGRGSILDRNGELLGISIDVDSIFAAPSSMQDLPKAALLLAGALGRTPARLEKSLRPT